MQISRNPYHFFDKPPTLQQSVLVFMDILGYSEMIRQSDKTGTQQDLLQRIYRALSINRTLFDQYRSERSERDFFALKAFTDNIVIGWPVHFDAEPELGNAFSELSLFQLQMTLEGFFVRGALSVGDAYVDEIAVFGNALTEAIHGESMLARDPRIILTSSAVKTVKKHLTYYSKPSYAPHIHDVLQDSDGQWFLNYLDCVLIAEQEQGPFYEELIQHKTMVEKKLDEHQNNPGIWSKYAWVAGYHNCFCDLHNDYFKDQHKIKIDLFRGSPSLIVDL